MSGRHIPKKKVYTYLFPFIDDKKPRYQDSIIIFVCHCAVRYMTQVSLMLEPHTLLHVHSGKKPRHIDFLRQTSVHTASIIP